MMIIRIVLKEVSYFAIIKKKKNYSKINTEVGKFRIATILVFGVPFQKA